VCGVWAQGTETGDTYRIAGVVVDSAGQSPLANVHVSVTDNQAKSQTGELTTGSDGRFVFEGMPEGSWTLSAERKGYLPQLYGQHADMGPGISVITGPHGMSEDLTLRLDPPAAISGKVTDEYGEPVVGAMVQLVMRAGGGRKEFVVRKTANTNDLGEYRIWGIPPVMCYLAVAVNGDRNWGGYATQYYRGTEDPENATAFTLRPGEEFHADFKLTPADGVMFFVTRDPEIPRGEDTELMVLLGEGPQGSEITVGTSQPEPGLARIFHSVPPGRYKLVISDTGSTNSTSRWVEVEDDEVRVQVPFENPPDVTARVRVVDGDAGLLKHATLRLHMASDAGNNTRPLGQDGTARFAAMAAGVYQVTLASSRELYIKSVTARNATVRDGLVELPESGAVQVEIVAGGDGGAVRGKVLAEGRPLQGAEVVLAPKKESENPEEFHGYVSDSDGSFDMKGVKPGEYVLFATRDRELDYTDLKAIRPFLAAGKVVKVEARGLLEVQVELQQR
jgi:hypothetical protein